MTSWPRTSSARGQTARFDIDKDLNGYVRTLRPIGWQSSNHVFNRETS